MMVPENVIVTIKTERTSEQWDMEIPTNLPMGELKQLLGVALSTLLETRVLQANAIRLMYQGRILTPNDTLASVGALDGSYIMVGGEGL